MMIKRRKYAKTVDLPIVEVNVEPFFLDCGAYGLRKERGKEFPLEEYLQWIVKEHRRTFRIALPDVIGDADESFALYRKALEWLERTVGKEWDKIRRKLVWTYHLTDGKPWVAEDMAKLARDYGLEWMAGGGMLGKVGRKERLKFSAWLGRLREKYGFKLHYWGVTSGELLSLAGASSSDTSAPFTAMRDGRMLVWQDGEVRAVSVKCKERGVWWPHCNSVNTLLLYEEWLKEEGKVGQDFKFIFVVSKPRYRCPPHLARILTADGGRALVSWLMLR